MITPHPTYLSEDFERLRLVFEGGPRFIARYLEQHMQEEQVVWQKRARLTYNPAFAREAVIEYANAITQRAEDIDRTGGSTLYHKVCSGELAGVDNAGASMNTFMCTQIVPELLAMRRVAICVDNDLFSPESSLADTVNSHPYLYCAKAESILNWNYDHSNRLTNVLLCSDGYKYEKGLPIGLDRKYRLFSLESDGVLVETYNSSDELTDSVKLNIPMIPVVILEISQSLIKEAAGYQIALLNLSSSNFFYAWGGNFPFYTEQVSATDFRRFNETKRDDNPVDPALTGIRKIREQDEKESSQVRVKVGTFTGRQYPLGVDRPGFINPSTEPMIAGMKKEVQLKNDIRALVGLAVTALDPTLASAESKEKDRESGLEAGLSQIGRCLESAENLVAPIFAAFENSKKIAVTKYPSKYNLKSDKDRRESAKELTELQPAVPSREFQREIGVEIVRTLFSGSRTADEVAKMEEEVRKSAVPTADPDTIRTDHEAGLVSDATASEGRGYLPGEAEQAAKDHAKRLARIKEAQSPGMGAGFSAGARGVGDEDEAPSANAAKEKQESQNGDLDKSGRKES